MTADAHDTKPWPRLQRYWEVLNVLTARNLKVRYRGSFLGVYWSLLNPLFMTLIYTVIFGTTFAKYYNNSIVDYVLAVFAGLVVVNFFAAATSQALPSVVANSSLSNKIALPFSVFPMSLILANGFQLAIGAFPFLLIITAITSKNLINIILLIVPLIALILTSAGVALIVSTLYVYFRDIPYIYELVTFVFWITSPLFYPIAIVPEPIRKFIIWNPLATIMESIRNIALSAAIPDFRLMGQAIASGILIALLGFIVFKRYDGEFADLL